MSSLIKIRFIISIATTLVHLLIQRQWTLLDTLLTSTPCSAILIDEPSLPHPVTSDIIIHFAARLQAPLRIISLLSKRYPHSLATPDVNGRYPIHVASKWAATPDVIAYLINANLSVVGVPDSIGKTPMHYAGEFYLQHFNDALSSPDDSQWLVVQLLTTAAPQSLNLEDNDGMNAIEYALESNADLQVIKTIQRACCNDWRERSKSNNIVLDNNGGDNAASGQKTQLQGRRRHDELVRDMEAMALRHQTEISSYGVVDGEMLNNDGIHVHRRRTSEAMTRAARTA